MAAAISTRDDPAVGVPELGAVVPLGIELVAWPAESAMRDALARAGIPRLLTVAAGELPPTDLARDEDWIRMPCDHADITMRAERVLRDVRERSHEPSWVDGQRVLHRGGLTAVLTPSEATVAEALLAEPGAIVSRSVLSRLLWPSGAPSERAVDAVIYRLRQSCRELGLVIRSARGRGFLLEV